MLNSLILAVTCAIQAPQVATIESDPYAGDPLDVRSRIEAFNVDNGVASILVSYSVAPTASPAVEFTWRTNGKQPISSYSTGSSWPQAVTGYRANTYRFTIAVPEEVNAERIIPLKRVKFGGVRQPFEGGGFVVVQGGKAYAGRTGSFIVGGKAYDFVNGVLVDLAKNAAAVPPTVMRSAPMLRSRSLAPLPPQPMVKGIKLAFPLALPKGGK